MTPESVKLNLGCGFKKVDGFWNVDIENRCSPDQQLDIETLPWPYEDSFFEKIMANQILTQVGKDSQHFIGILKEMYRVSRDKAEWAITVPHHRSDLHWEDFTNRRTLTPGSFMMFDQAKNVHDIESRNPINVLGLLHDIDIEVYDVNFDINRYWKQQVSDGFLGNKELEVKLGTISNIAETVTVFCRIHKPGRFRDHLLPTA